MARAEKRNNNMIGYGILIEEIDGNITVSGQMTKTNETILELECYRRLEKIVNESVVKMKSIQVSLTKDNIKLVNNLLNNIGKDK